MATKTTIVCNSTESKSLYATLILGSSAAALGNDVILFFSVSASESLKKGALEKIDVKGMPDILELYQAVLDLKGKIYLCELALEVKGIKKEDLREGVELVGATTYMSEIQDAQITLSF